MNTKKTTRKWGPMGSMRSWRDVEGGVVVPGSILSRTTAHRAGAKHDRQNRRTGRAGLQHD